jgi:8-oxo-dGTP pyrophosphatase MutT (NUDIX family)
MNYEAACVLAIENGKVLAVSRKNDPTAFGLPGGKVEPGDTTRKTARLELLQETGYDIAEEDLMLIYVGKSDDKYTCYTYLANCSLSERHPVSEDETGIVEWITPNILINGPFGKYNRQMLIRYHELAFSLERFFPRFVPMGFYCMKCGFRTSNQRSFHCSLFNENVFNEKKTDNCWNMTTANYTEIYNKIQNQTP